MQVPAWGLIRENANTLMATRGAKLGLCDKNGIISEDSPNNVYTKNQLGGMDNLAGGGRTIFSQFH